MCRKRELPAKIKPDRRMAPCGAPANTASSEAGGRVLFASPEGGDDAPGTQASPVSLPAAARYAGPGTEIVLLGGLYALTEPFIPARGGDEDRPLVIRAARDEHVVLDAMNLSTGAGSPSTNQLSAIILENLRHVRLIGLNVRNSQYAGFLVRGDDSHDIELRFCSSAGSYGPGICLRRGSHLRVLDCEVAGANDQALRVHGTPLRKEAPHEALSLMQVKHFEIARCRIHHCHKEGIDVKETASHGSVHHNECHDLARQGIYVDCWFGRLTDVDIHDNIVHHCQWGIAVSAEGRDATLDNIRIYDNRIYGNRASGILMGTWGADGPRRDLWICHNTICCNGSPNHWIGDTGGVDIRSKNLRDLQICNNIIRGNHAFDIATFAAPGEAVAQLRERNIVIARNLTGPLRPAPGRKPPPEYPSVNPIPGEEPVIGDPQFVVPDGVDMRLKPGSPARGPDGETLYGWRDTSGAHNVPACDFE